MTTHRVPEGFLNGGICGATTLVGKLHHFVKLHTDLTVVLAGDGEAVAGVLYEEGATDAQVTYQYGGIGKCIAAETIAPMARIACDADGKAVTAAVGDYEIGTCIAGGDADEIISFIFASGRRHA